MGTYINIGNAGFQSARNGEYVDKSGLISVINSTLNTERRFTCVSRCRRFGKSMAAKMLNAYYDWSCDSQGLFVDLKITSDVSFEKYLNKFPVIYLDISDFVTRFHDDDILSHIDAELIEDIHLAYPDVPVQSGDDLMKYLIRVNATNNQPFIFIIDEWDAICREFSMGTSAMDRYVNWLRRMFKGGLSMQVFAGVYMTGILVLAKKYHVDIDELEKWYDGYQIGDELSMFNPNSVMQAVSRQRCRSYWASTGAYEAVAKYIGMNFDGLKDDVITLLGGGRVKVNTTKFQNDMSNIQRKDDVLTVLIHLGYLSFNWKNNECYIPNLEVAGELANAVEDTDWKHVVKALEQSERLLQATLNGDEETVARCVDLAHDEHTSILSYNDENSLACVLSIAYYYARNNYVMHRELATGKGFADIVLVPRKNVESPAIILELKYDKDADTAIDQIKRKEYPAKIAEYLGDILLVGINYDKQSKTHSCRIERYSQYGKSNW